MLNVWQTCQSSLESGTSPQPAEWLTSCQFMQSHLVNKWDGISISDPWWLVRNQSDCGLCTIINMPWRTLGNFYLSVHRGQNWLLAEHTGTDSASAPPGVRSQTKWSTPLTVPSLGLVTRWQLCGQVTQRRYLLDCATTGRASAWLRCEDEPSKCCHLLGRCPSHLKICISSIF